jgi:UrcA family protein
MLKELIHSAALTLLPLALSTAALAEESADDIRISYADIDLGTASGVKTLDRRIKHAIATVCPRTGLDLWAQIAAENCRAEKRSEISVQRDRALAGASGEVAAVAAAR